MSSFGINNTAQLSSLSRSLTLTRLTPHKPQNICTNQNELLTQCSLCCGECNKLIKPNRKHVGSKKLPSSYHVNPTINSQNLCAFFIISSFIVLYKLRIET